MHFRGLLAAAAVLGLLSIGVWFSNKAEKEKEGKPAPDAPPKIVEIPSDSVSKVEIAKGGATTVLERGADGKWSLKAPKEFRADQEAVTTLVNTFNSLASDRLVDEKGNPADFGLVNPSMTVTVGKKEGPPVKLLFGDETPTGGGVFAKLDGDPRIFIIASYNRSSIDKGFADLQDRRLVTFDGDKVTRIEMTLKGKTVEFGKNAQNEWQIVKPKPMRADGAAVDDLVRRLKEAKMDAPAGLGDEAAGEAAKTAREFASAAAVATARVTDAAGTHTLEVRKAKDATYYAKGTAVDGAHKITADLGDGVSKSLDDFRQKKLFDFGWNDLSKVEVKDNGAVRAFAKDKDNWKEGAKELDSTSVQSLIDKMRDLSAASFPDAGGGSPVFEASAAWSDGKRSEKVIVSQAGDNFFAVREGEPAVYRIDKQAFEDLRNAAKDVKAPAPPAKDEKKK
ncbi:MAG: DUF4340 domain-containing protein [Bryobacteraceae bacterium]